MSAEALAIALNHSRATGTAKLVLIGIANHDGDGGSWPSIPTLAGYANVDERSVQRSIEKLEKLGEARRIVQKGGTHLTRNDRRPNLYQFLLRCPADCDGTTQHRTRKQVERQQVIGGLEAPEAALGGVTPVSPQLSTGAPHGVTPASPHGVTPASPEPVLRTRAKDPETKSSDRARTFVPVFEDDRCPGNWKDSVHVLAVTGMCAWCHQRPTMVDPVTGETK